MLDKIDAIHERLDKVMIENRDFETLIKQYDFEDAFFYCDPPYSQGCGYDVTSTKDFDHERLREVLGNIKGRFLLSYDDSPKIRELYKGFEMIEVERLNGINNRSDVENRKKIFRELLIANIQLRNFMSDKPIEIEFDNKEVHEKLLDLAKKTENLRPLMKNIAGIFAYSTEENFKEEGRPDKWLDLAESTKKQRTKKRKWPGQILQVEGKLAASINTYYDNDSAVIGSNLEYAAIHQLGGQAGRNKSVEIPARPYIFLTDGDYDEILHNIDNYLSDYK